MKTLAGWVCAVFVFVLVLGVAVPAFAGGKTHQVAGTIVSVDKEHKTITFKMDGGDEEKTAPVMDKAVKQMSEVKAGDHVSLTCTDSEKGEHQGISAIKKG